MKSIISVIIIILFSAVTIFFGCKDTVTASQIDSVVIPSTNVSYSKYIQPVFNNRCTPSCHNSFSTDAGINLTSWSGVVANPNVVFPYQPDNSTLVLAIEGNPSVPAMPPKGVYKPLTSNQIQGVITWIKEGAKNN
jgi:hypothetical protein